MSPDSIQMRCFFKKIRHLDKDLQRESHAKTHGNCGHPSTTRDFQGSQPRSQTSGLQNCNQKRFNLEYFVMATAMTHLWKVVYKLCVVEFGKDDHRGNFGTARS